MSGTDSAINLAIPSLPEEDDDFAMQPGVTPRNKCHRYVAPTSAEVPGSQR